MTDEQTVQMSVERGVNVVSPDEWCPADDRRAKSSATRQSRGEAATATSRWHLSVRAAPPAVSFVISRWISVIEERNAR